MNREDIIQEFKQNEGSFKFVVIELISGENVIVNAYERVHFSFSSLTIYYLCRRTQIYYHNIRGLEVINNIENNLKEK